MNDTRNCRRLVLLTALWRVAPVLAVAALLAPVTAVPADAAGTAGYAGQLGSVAGSGPEVAVPAGFRPASASFLSPASGFVLGGVGCQSGRACAARLVATADGGAHWRFLKTPGVRLPVPARGPRASDVSSVVFVSRRAGWLYGPALWSTRDGGAHWRKLSLGGAVGLMAASAGRVYALVAPPSGKPPELFASPAGRTAWARVGRLTGSILAVSGRAAWLGTSTYLRATADGVHWHRYPFLCPGPTRQGFGLASITAASPSDVTFLCLGEGGAGSREKEVLSSVNGGRTVHLAGPAPSGGSGGVIAVPPRRPQVITLAAGFFLDRSADGGKTWTEKVVNPGGASWNSLSYVSRTAGWAEFGSPPDGELLRTTDVGRTWHQVRFARPARPVTAFIANQGSDTVTPIRTATNTALKAIKVGPDPRGIAITPNGKTAYVANYGGIAAVGDTVTPIQTATNKVGKAIKVGDNPQSIAITPDGKTAYVANYGSGTVTPIRTATNAALKAIKVGSDPYAMAVTPNGKITYVTSGSGLIPISTATNKAGKAIKVFSAFAFAITPNGKTAYVTGSGTVTPVNTATNKALKPIKVGTQPFAIAITPNGKTAYVANYGSGTVTPISTATNKALKPIKVGKGPDDIAITPSGRTAYVANVVSDTVTPISTATNKAGKPIRVGSNPFNIAITPNGKTVYAVNDNFRGTVTPISTATNTALKAIKAGRDPYAIAITP